MSARYIFAICALITTHILVNAHSAKELRKAIEKYDNKIEYREQINEKRLSLLHNHRTELLAQLKVLTEQNAMNLNQVITDK